MYIVYVYLTYIYLSMEYYLYMFPFSWFLLFIIELDFGLRQTYAVGVFSNGATRQNCPRPPKLKPNLTKGGASNASPFVACLSRLDAEHFLVAEHFADVYRVSVLPSIELWVSQGCSRVDRWLRQTNFDWILRKWNHDQKCSAIAVLHFHCALHFDKPWKTQLFAFVLLTK